MASTLETLVVRLTADATKLEQELNNQVRRSETAGAKIGRAFSVAARSLAGLGTAAAGVATALTLAANKAAGYADEVDKAAIRTRLARSTVQELRFVADQAGGSFQAIEANVRAFTGRLAEMERGSKVVAGTFDRLGVSVYDANGALRDTEALFLDTITALAGVENETERAALAVSAFGETGTELLPIISQGAGGIDELRQKARDLGVVLDDQSIATLVQYKDQLSSVQQQFGALQRELALGILPVLTDKLLPALEGGLEAFRDLPEPLQKTATAAAAAAVGMGALAVAANAMGIALAPLLGPAGLIVSLGVVTGTLVESLITQESRIGDLISKYQSYRGEIVATTEQERQAAIDRLNQTRTEIQERIRLLERLAESQRSSVQSFVDSPIGRFLLPGFLNIEGSASQTTLSDIERLREALGQVGEDIAKLEGGATRLVVPPPTPAPPPTPTATGPGGADSDGSPTGTIGPFPVASSLNRQLEDAGTVGRGVVLAAQEQAAKDAAAWVANRLSVTTASLRADEDAGTVGRAETTAMLDEKKANAERALGAWWANRFAVTQRSLRLDEDAGTMGRAESNSIAAARAAAAAAEAEQAAVDFMLLRLQATTASFRQSEDAGTVGRAETNAILEEKKAEANRAIGEWFAMRIAVTTASFRADEDAGTMGRAAFMAFEPGWKSRAALAGKPGSPFDQSWRDRGSGGQYQGPLVKQGVEDLRLAGEEFRANVVESSILFGTNLVNAFKSGDPSSIFGAVTGGIGSILGLFNPLAGEFFSLFGGLGSALIGLGRNEESEATRALGASTRGAPAVEFNVTVNQSLSIASLTGEGRRAVDGLLNDTASRIEAVITRNVLPRLGYLEERIA